MPWNIRRRRYGTEALTEGEIQDTPGVAELLEARHPLLIAGGQHQAGTVSLLIAGKLVSLSSARFPVGASSRQRLKRPAAWT